MRSTQNPLDKSTIVSILPKEVHEVKHTIQPGNFLIGPGTYDKPALLVVGPSSFFREIYEEEQLLEITSSSVVVAKSVVDDFCRSLDRSDLNKDALPGLFWVPGELSIAGIRKDFMHLLNDAKKKQDNWFRALVEQADVLWSRTNKNPLSISDLARLAATELALKETKEWMGTYKAIEMVPCKACGELRNPTYPVCKSCNNIIDKKLAQDLGILPAA